MKDQFIEAALKDIQARPPAHAGICYNLKKVLRQQAREGSAEWLSLAFARLGLSTFYPVPHPDFKNNDVAYERLWGRSKWEGKYGDNRKYLLSLLILIAQGVEPESLTVSWPFP